MDVQGHFLCIFISQRRSHPWVLLEIIKQFYLGLGSMDDGLDDT